MNVKIAYKYQLADHKKSILTFYCIIFAILIMLSVVTVDLGNSSSTFGGMESATAIFAFVAGLSFFKEPFFMLMQNGVSRKSVFKSRILVTLTVAGIMAAVDQIVLVLGKAIAAFNDGFQYLSLFEQIYQNRLAQESAFFLHINIYLFDGLLYLSCIVIGYFISIMFYRLNKAGKIAVGAGVPVGLLILLPIIDSTLFHSRISAAFARFFDIAFGYSAGNPFAAMITFTVSFLIISLFTWLLMKKAAVRA